MRERVKEWRLGICLVSSSLKATAPRLYGARDNWREDLSLFGGAFSSIHQHGLSGMLLLGGHVTIVASEVHHGVVASTATTFNGSWLNDERAQDNVCCAHPRRSATF